MSTAGVKVWEPKRLDFAEFYREAADECLCIVLISVGDQDAAQDVADEAFGRAWAVWRTVTGTGRRRRGVVRTALSANISR